MSDPMDVQKYIQRENERRGHGEDEDGEEEDRGRGRLYGMSEWENPTADGRFGGYTRGSI